MRLPQSTEGLALLGLLVEISEVQISTGTTLDGRPLNTPWRVLRAALMGRAREVFGASFDYNGAEQDVLNAGAAMIGRFRSGWKYLVPERYFIRESEPRPNGPTVKSDQAAIERYARLAAAKPAASNNIKARRK